MQSNLVFCQMCITIYRHISNNINTIININQNEDYIYDSLLNIQVFQMCLKQERASIKLCGFSLKFLTFSTGFHHPSFCYLKIT